MMLLNKDVFTKYKASLEPTMLLFEIPENSVMFQPCAADGYPTIHLNTESHPKYCRSYLNMAFGRSEQSEKMCKAMKSTTPHKKSR